MKQFRIAWTVLLLVMAVVLLYLTFSGRDLDLVSGLDGASWVTAAVLLTLGAFFCEYIDSSLGMGYGTTLTPVLMILGFAPLQIIPAVLLSEFLSGVTAGLLHHRAGNVQFTRGSRDTKVMGVLALCSIVGTCLAVVVALSLPREILKTWIGVLVLAMGILVLWGPEFAKRFSWPKIVGLGLVAAFNKGMSGGGYGPVVTGGQILSGVDPKRSVGITSLAEGLVCLVGVTLYLVLQRGAICWTLAGPLAVGALLSVPLATWTVKIMPPTSARRSIGLATTFLGALTLARVLTG